MKYEWDENKNRSNLEKHGIDFSDALAVFLDEDRIEVEDDRKDYGERHYRTVGLVDNLLIVAVIYTPRSGARRIISAQRANRDEKSAYYRERY